MPLFETFNLNFDEYNVLTRRQHIDTDTPRKVGHGGLVIRSRIRDRRFPVSDPDSTKDPSCFLDIVNVKSDASGCGRSGLLAMSRHRDWRLPDQELGSISGPLYVWTWCTLNLTSWFKRLHSGVARIPRNASADVALVI
ncbi:hypothetical protein AVEN_206048-1 [Araneus ventricosus]|uniref:Uncharacterized protein n=1 Tax=Araneus ventricosus TaxID=182803 RepID=A0A4Y2KE63_ARAVE|nr:hypothetical protein AVEN_206048-1 [Araneus ventricosus]